MSNSPMPAAIVRLWSSTNAGGGAVTGGSSAGGVDSTTAASFSISIVPAPPMSSAVAVNETNSKANAMALILRITGVSF